MYPHEDSTYMCIVLSTHMYPLSTSVQYLSKLKNICNVNVARIARKRKARRNKKFGECITPIRYNFIHMYIFFFVRFVLFLANPSVIFIIIIIITLYSEFFASYIMCVMFSLTVLSKHASVGCLGG